MPGGVGIDLIEIGRMERALERRPRLAGRLFTAGELETSQARRRPGRHLAARFAAKEAVIKALAAGGVSVSDIEIVGGGDSPPEAVLRGRALEAAAGRKVEISISHSELSATAIALLR